MRFDEEGNALPGKMIDMVVEGENVYIVSVRGRTGNLLFLLFFCFLPTGRRRGPHPFRCVKRDTCLAEKHLACWIVPTAWGNHLAT